MAAFHSAPPGGITPPADIYPVDEQGYWLLIWRDSEIEIKRFHPETKRFTYNRPAAAGA